VCIEDPMRILPLGGNDLDDFPHEEAR